MRRACRICIPILLMLLLTACSAGRIDRSKVREVSFTVLDKEEIPEELLAEIDEAKAQEMKLSYGDKGSLYVARGYGEQKTSGYSVTVSQCYESPEGIVCKTSLLGPGKDEKIIEKETYPYVVIKMEYTEKPVIFE